MTEAEKGISNDLQSINSEIRGFEIKNRTIGIFSKDADNAIINCRIVKNWMTGIVCVRHLPKIEDNIIAFNRASGIQGWDVRATTGSINHNTIAFNANNGIALGGVSDIFIENNMIAFNERFGIKLSANSEKSPINRNNVFGNLTEQVNCLRAMSRSTLNSPRRAQNSISRSDRNCRAAPTVPTINFWVRG